MKLLEHVAGPYIDNVQKCMRCGDILADYRNAMVLVGDPAPSGWPRNAIVLKSVGTNPIMTIVKESYDQYMNQGDDVSQCERPPAQA